MGVHRWNRGDTAVVVVVAAAALVSALGFELATTADGFRAGFRAVPLDDSWIHYVYARALGTTLRLDYNPGQSEAGFTSLLWVVMLAPGQALGLAPVPLSKALGLACHAALAGVVYAWLRPLAPRAVAAGASLLTAVEPVFSFAALSGMEVMPYALALVAATHLLLRGRLVACALALALAVAARPDGLVLVVAVAGTALLHAATRRFRDRTFSPGRLALLVACPLAVAAVWSLYCRVATGMWVPTSYYVRADGVAFLGNLRYLDRIVDEIGYALTTLGHPWKAALMVPGAAWALWRLRTLGVLLVGFPAVFALAMGGEVIGIMGGSFLGNRYLVPVFPFLLGLQVLGVAALVAPLSRGAGHAAGRGRAALPTIVGVALLAGLLWPPRDAIGRRRESQQTFALSCENIEQMQVAIGRWIAAETPPDAVVATHDAGAIRYLGERETWDILGLNTTDVGAEDPDRIDAEADVLVTFPEQSRELARRYRDRELLRVTLADNEVCADDTMVVYGIR